MKSYLLIIFLLSITVLAAQDHLAWITATPDTIYFDENETTSTIQAKVVDDDDNPVAGANVVFDCNIGHLIYNATTNSSGIAETEFWESGDLGVATITVARGGEVLYTQVTIVLPSSSEHHEIPALITELKNYPNPFNPSTSISFNLQNSGFVTLEIYNIKGQRVAKLINENMTSGKHIINWQADDVSAGIYFASLKSGNQSFKQKMILLK